MNTLNTLNKLGMETSAKFAFSKDFTRGLIKIIASYKPELEKDNY